MIKQNITMTKLMINVIKSGLPIKLVCQNVGYILVTDSNHIFWKEYNVLSAQAYFMWFDVPYSGLHSQIYVIVLHLILTVLPADTQGQFDETKYYYAQTYNKCDKIRLIN